jgi:hypothetical protein
MPDLDNRSVEMNQYSSQDASTSADSGPLDDIFDQVFDALNTKSPHPISSRRDSVLDL